MLSGLITGNLPEEIICSGKGYPVFTDFRAWIEIERVLFEKEGNFADKLPTLLTLCSRTLPETLAEAVNGMAAFYAGGAPRYRADKRKRCFRRLYSFSQDASLIYAGFYQQYGMDLTKAQLHWFQFKALLAGLSEDTQFVRAMHYRAVDVSSLKSKEQRQFYRRMKELYRLRDYRSEAEREADVSKVLEDLF